MVRNVVWLGERSPKVLRTVPRSGGFPVYRFQRTVWSPLTGFPSGGESIINPQVSSFTGNGALVRRADCIVMITVVFNYTIIETDKMVDAGTLSNYRGTHEN